MHTDTLATTDRADTATLEPVVRLALSVLGTAALIGLGLLLPGTDWIVVEPGVSVGDLIVTTGATAIVAGLLAGGPRVRNFLSARLDGPADVVASLAAIGATLVDFVAVLVAHRGLAPTLRPLLDPGWLYDALFAAVAVGLLVVMASRFWRAREPLVASLTEWVAGPEEPDVADGGGVRDDGVTDNDGSTHDAEVAGETGSP